MADFADFSVQYTHYFYEGHYPNLLWSYHASSLSPCATCGITCSKEANLPICSFGAEFSSHFKFPALTYVFSFCHPGRSSLCCWTAGSLCSFCSWPQLLGRAKGGLQCLSPSQALPGPPQLDSPDSINTLQRTVHSWIPAQPWHCEIFSSNSPFNDHVQSQQFLPASPFTPALYHCIIPLLANLQRSTAPAQHSGGI